MKEIPKIGQRYNCFDDGKISYNRLYTVDVKEVVPFDKIDKTTLKKWKEEVEECYWLYAKETDFFIKTENGEDGDAVFVRTINGGWFSIGNFMNSGRLDVDGELTEMLNVT
jgi:16S rRNA U516 pseudouridylate synthase RsuA-like enzyme